MLRTIRSFKDSIFSWDDSIRWKKKKQRALRFLQGTYAWTTCAFCSTCCMHYKGALILILAKINIMCWTMRALEASNLQRHNKASHTQIYAQPTRYNLKHILNPKNNSCSSCRLRVLTQSAYFMLARPTHNYSSSLFSKRLCTLSHLLLYLSTTRRAFVLLLFIYVGFIFHKRNLLNCRASILFCFFVFVQDLRFSLLGLCPCDLRAGWIFFAIPHVRRFAPHPWL